MAVPCVYLLTCVQLLVFIHNPVQRVHALRALCLNTPGGLRPWALSHGAPYAHGMFFYNPWVEQQIYVAGETCDWPRLWQTSTLKRYQVWVNALLHQPHARRAVMVIESTGLFPGSPICRFNFSTCAPFNELLRTDTSALKHYRFVVCI